MVYVVTKEFGKEILSSFLGCAASNPNSNSLLTIPFYSNSVTIGRLLTLEQNRNLIETQEVGHGVTC